MLIAGEVAWVIMVRGRDIFSGVFTGFAFEMYSYEEARDHNLEGSMAGLPIFHSRRLVVSKAILQTGAIVAESCLPTHQAALPICINGHSADIFLCAHSAIPSG